MIPPSGTGTSGKRSSKVPIIAAIVAGVLLIVGIRYFTTRDDDPAAGTEPRPTGGTPRCSRPGTAAPPCNVAASSEKAALLGEIANSYRDSGPHRRRQVLRHRRHLGGVRHRRGEPGGRLGRDAERPGAGRLDARPRRPGSACCKAT